MSENEIQHYTGIDSDSWVVPVDNGHTLVIKTKIETINFKKGPQVFPKGDILGPEILHDEASSCIDF